MAMGVMPPMMAHVAVTVPPSIPILAQPPQQPSPQPRSQGKRGHGTGSNSAVIEKKPLVRRNQQQAHENTSKGPPVTVFVGNITERASDNLIRLILQRCGTVVSWKRVQGANGWLQGFGFCEYGDPESAMRAIRILHDWEIGDKKLVVKVDAKTKEKLDDYKANKRNATGQQQSQQQPSGPADGTPAADGANSEAKPQPTDDIDEATWRQDRDTREAILHLLRSHSSELTRGTERERENERSNNTSKSPRTTRRNSPEPEREYRSSKNHRLMQELDEMDIEEDKRNLITREIDKFRDTYKKQQEEDRDRERERRRERKERRERSPDRSSRSRDKERLARDSSKDDRAEERSSRDRDRESSREPKPPSDSAQPASSSQPPPPSRSDRAPSKSRSESPERDWVRERERERERELREVMRPRDSERDWEREREEEEEAYERKKLERKLREKEAAYQERLRNWEARERRKAKDYEKERLKEEERQTEEAKEARRLKEFLEDYEDERDDVKYYKGTALQRRMKDREKEIELDNRDRQRECDELNGLRKKLRDEGHPDPEAEAKRIHHEEEARLLKPPPHLLPVVRPEPPEPEAEPTRVRDHPSSPPPARRSSQHSRVAPLSPKAEPRSPPPRRENASSRRTRSPSPQSAATSSGHAATVDEDGSCQNSLSGFSDVATPQEEGRSMGFGVLKLGGSPGQTSGRKSPSSSSKRKKLSAAASEAFGNADEEESAEARRKRKLVPLEDEEARKQQEEQQQQQVQHMNTEEKRKHIKSLIDRIPTSKEELFNFNFDRSLVDNALMDKRIRPWINKKIVEYIGEEEPTLVDFICSKVLAGSAAQSILNDVSMVLDEEAEVFVVKMWRLLIYEIEAKKVGLVK